MDLQRNREKIDRRSTSYNKPYVLRRLRNVPGDSETASALK